MLKIAHIGSLWHSIPPKGYGGTERIIWSLIEGFHKKGYQLTLYASGTAKTSAKLVAIHPQPLIEDNVPWTNLMYPLLNITACLDNESNYDLIHMHLNKSSDYLALPLIKRIKNKVVITVHFPYPADPNRHDRHQVLQKYKELNYVSISDIARLGGENLNWNGTVYNGIEKSEFSYNAKPEDYFLWLGKFNPDKGPHHAIDAAKKAKVKLILAGKIDQLEKEDFEYYKKKIKPFIDGKQIQYVGEVSGKKKSDIFGKAKAFLNPIVWNEPFGLVMAEALATGTPVISFDRGAAREIIEEGKSGYLVNSVAEMVAKIKQVDQLSRSDCRKRFESMFSAEIMVNNYEKLYQKLVS